MEDWQTYGNGDLLTQSDVTNSVRLTIYDGCISSARIDLNDPHLEVTGSIIGSISGLSQAGSSLRFAMGDYLIETIPINLGSFSVSIPIGHALPSHADSVEFGVASRFQWASDGSPETLVIHIESVSISGGYLLEWDRDPVCMGSRRYSTS